MRPLFALAASKASFGKRASL